MLHAVIMAGGSGTRFWPKSRTDMPKQLMQLYGDRTMLQHTMDRLAPLATPERTLVVTNEVQSRRVTEQLPGLPRDHVIAEPCGRDTAACIGLAATIISCSDPDGTMVATPADQLIEPPGQFQRTLRVASQIVERSPHTFVTFGIRPSYPATGYGYIHRGELIETDDGINVYRVRRFREKPDRDLAERFLQSADYFWNSGIFVWRVDAILNALDEFTPELGASLKRIRDALGTADSQRVIAREYDRLDKVSIDYAVMEGARDVQVVEAPYRWDDLGSWAALERLHPSDAHDNTVMGKHCGMDTRDCLVLGDDQHMIATLGVSDLIIVHSADATLIAHKREEESVRKLVDKLRAEGHGDFL